MRDLRHDREIDIVIKDDTNSLGVTRDLLVHRKSFIRVSLLFSFL